MKIAIALIVSGAALGAIGIIGRILYNIRKGNYL